MCVGTKTGANGLFWESITTRQPKACVSNLSIFEGKSDEETGTCVGRQCFVGGAHRSQGLCSVRIFGERLQDFTGLNLLLPDM